MPAKLRLRLEAYCEKFRITKAQALMNSSEKLYKQDEKSGKRKSYEAFLRKFL